MTRPKGPRVGRQFVMDHTQRLLDPSLLMTGNAARLLYLDVRLLSAANGTEGHFTKNARELDFSLRLDGGTAEVEASVAALVAAGKVVDAGDTWRIADWDETQFDMGGSKTRSETSKLSQLVRRHNEGKHVDDPREDCSLCQEGPTTAAVKVLASVEPAQEPTALVAVPPAPEVEKPAKRGTKELVAEFRATFPGVFASYDKRLDGYRVLLKAAEELAEANAHLSTEVRGTLMNAILADALDFYLDGAVKGSDYGRAYRGAKSLDNKYGHWFYILGAEVTASAALDESKGSPVGYVAQVAASKRTEYLEKGL